MLQNQHQGTSLTAFSQYMREVNWIPQLTSEEETQLLRGITTGVDIQRSRDRLVEGYQTMLLGLAKRFARNCQHMETLDFVQEGNIGLLQAIEQYDCRRDAASFRTFAFSWVRGHMLMAYWRDERAICVPMSKVRAIRQMNVVTTQLLALLGREPTLREVARKMEVSESDVHELTLLQEQPFVSLHMPLDEDGETSLEDVLEDPATSGENNLSSLQDVLAILTEQERSVLQLRYGLVGGCTYSQQEVARLLGIGLSVVQKVDRRARMRLREALAA